MSDYHRVCMHFDLRHDTPEPLIRALKAISAGQEAAPDDLVSLPYIYQGHLLPPNPSLDGTRSNGTVAIRMSQHQEIETEAPLYSFYFEAIYHDDAWANWCMYFQFAMFGHAAHNGYLSSLEANAGDIPELYIKDGPDIIVVNFGTSGSVFFPHNLEQTMLDANNPIQITGNYRMNIKEVQQEAESITLQDLM